MTAICGKRKVRRHEINLSRERERKRRKKATELWRFQCQYFSIVYLAFDARQPSPIIALSPCISHDVQMRCYQRCCCWWCYRLSFVLRACIAVGVFFSFNKLVFKRIFTGIIICIINVVVVFFAFGLNVSTQVLIIFSLLFFSSLLSRSEWFIDISTQSNIDRPSNIYLCCLFIHTQFPKIYWNTR